MKADLQNQRPFGAWLLHRAYAERYPEEVN